LKLKLKQLKLGNRTLRGAEETIKFTAAAHLMIIDEEEWGNHK
jgi:hypothetical protein